MADDLPGYPTPPLPPRLDGKIVFPWLRLVGVLVIFSIPLMALAGVFGATLESAKVSSPAFEVTVEYPKRLRYKDWQQISVEVRNNSANPITATIEFDRHFIEGFAEVKFTPSEKSAYVSELPSIRPGGSAVQYVELRGDRYGSNLGKLRVTAGNTSAETRLGVFVFP